MAGTHQSTNGTVADLSIKLPLQEQHMRLQNRLFVDEQYGVQIKEAEDKAAAGLKQTFSAYVGCRELSAWPSRFARTQFSREELHHALGASAGKRASIAFLPLDPHGAVDATHDGYERTHIGNDDDPGAFHVYWQVRRSGLLYQSSAMPEDLAHGDRAPMLSLDTTVEYAAQGFDYAGRFFEALIGSDEDVTVRLRLTAAHGRVLSDPYGAQGNGRACKLTDIVYETTLDVTELRHRRASVVTEAVNDIVQQCGWPHPPPREIRELADSHVTGAIYRHHHGRLIR